MGFNVNLGAVPFGNMIVIFSNVILLMLLVTFLISNMTVDYDVLTKLLIVPVSLKVVIGIVIV
jgi:hypothetical protein